MTTNSDQITESECNFDVSIYTKSALKLDMRIQFQGKTPEEVFEIMGDPERITDWYLLAKKVLLHPPNDDGQVDFDVEFAMFGLVREEILHWEMPLRYVYSAKGKDFPIKDYIALIEIRQMGEDKGELIWQQYFDHIEGEHNKRLLPVILPPINEQSLNCLAEMIGGTSVTLKSYM